MSLRIQNIDKLKSNSFDVLIVGGGINGAVSAAALSAKGAKVALIDKGDFAGSTSSNSSNLAWGGIKYLETHEYRLVNKLCQSRNLLMRSYPSTVKEIRFLTCIQKGFRFPPFFVYLGSLLYWAIGRCFTKFPDYLSPKKIKQREPMINTENAAGGLEYSDAYLFDNDARFVFNFIRSAMDSGCVAANYVASTGAEYVGGSWKIKLKDQMSGDVFTLQSKVFINACGPSVDVHNDLLGESTNYRHVFSKGVHLIVDRIAENKRVLAFFASDGRLFFVIPMGRKTCIGTTDTPTQNIREEVTDYDRNFILDNVNRLLNLPKPLTIEDIVSERCGVRPLVVNSVSNKGAGNEEGANNENGESTNEIESDFMQMSRKHKIESNLNKKHISIYGGKMTDCLNVGEEVSALVSDMGVELNPQKQLWYGEPSEQVKTDFFQQAKEMNLDDLTWEYAAEPLSERYWRRYGKNAFLMLDAIKKDSKQADLLIENAEYTHCEIEYTNQYEMITKLDDFLRRRSKISMVLRKEEILSAKGLKEACEVFFGKEADSKLAEYRDNK